MTVHATHDWPLPRMLHFRRAQQVHGALQEVVIFDNGGCSIKAGLSTSGKIL